MKQLLEIRSVPISLEFRVTHAKYEVKQQDTFMDVSRQKGGLSISSRAPQVRLDTVDMRASMGFKAPLRATEDMADYAQQVSVDAVGNYAMEGNQMMEAATSQIPEIASQRLQAASAVETQLGFMPSVPMNISVEPGDLSMQYEMDRLTFDWRVQNPEINYVPANIEYIVKEYPKLEINYVGSPIYVPPSSDPNYEPNPFVSVA